MSALLGVPPLRGLSFVVVFWGQYCAFKRCICASVLCRPLFKPDVAFLFLIHADRRELSGGPWRGRRGGAVASGVRVGGGSRLLVTLTLGPARIQSHTVFA